MAMTNLILGYPGTGKTSIAKALREDDKVGESLEAINYRDAGFTCLISMNGEIQLFLRTLR